jgi:predicted transcriptional regulator
MKKFYRISDSEMEIMRVIWDSADPVTVALLLDIFESRKWKAQTMATFLTRLADKGLISVNRQGKINLYAPAVTEQEYNRLEAQDLLSSMYDGSLKNFLSALYSGGGIDAGEAEELKKWFERAGKDD